MFQPNVAPWQQQQTQSQQQPPPLPPQQQHHQLQLQQHVQPQYPQQNIGSIPQVDGKWNQHGISATPDQQIPFQPFAYNTVENQPFLNNYVNYEQQQQQQSQPPQQINNATNLQAHQDHQSLTQNFFDNNQNTNNINNNNNNNGKGDEWGDWGDWNENNINMENNNQQKTQQQQALFNPQTQIQQPQQIQTSNIINESFSTSDNNWNWNMNINTEQPVNNVVAAATTTTSTNLTNSTVLPSPPAMQAQQQQVQRHISNFQHLPAQILDKTNESALQIITQENNAESLAGLSKSTLPASNNNIPNTVFVTQAKPVTMPSRQYASTPSEVSTPSSVDQIIPPPPEGFQNEAPKQQQQSVAVVPPPPASSITMPPPTTAGFGLPPAVGARTTVNPFKRAGTAQHHVANFIPTPTMPLKSNERPPVPLVFEQPDNSEVLHENQEVVNQTYAPIPQQQKQHLNDERNQYLQTSHLSENAMEDNVEADSLPPPGLSRLVLGEPELEGNQRLVTGTEDTLPDLVGNMRLDERQADGEDNTADSVVPGNNKKFTHLVP